MSWSLSAIGKPAAIAVKFAEEFAKNPCIDPEESVRQAVGVALAAALAAQGADVAVKVSASGHQGQNYGPKGEKTTVCNTLNISVEPINGFIG